MDCGWNICGGSHFVSSSAHFAGSANICLDQRLTFPWWRLYRGQSCVILLTVQCLGALLCSSIQQKCCVNQMWWIVQRAFWGLETIGRPCWSFLPFFYSFLKDDGKKYSRGIKTCLLRMTEKKDDWVATHRFQNNVCSLLLTSLILLMELTLSLFSMLKSSLHLLAEYNPEKASRILNTWQKFRTVTTPQPHIEESDFNCNVTNNKKSIFLYCLCFYTSHKWKNK